MRINDDVSRMSRHSLEHEVRTLRGNLQKHKVQNGAAPPQEIATDDELITREQHEAELKQQKDIDGTVNRHLNHLNNIWAVIQTLCFLDNGPNLRRVLGNTNSRILSALDDLDNALQQINNSPGLQVNYAKFQRTFDGSRELWRAVKTFLADEEDTDLRYKELQEFVRKFNPRILEVTGDAITSNRGKRKPDNELAKLLERIDGKIDRMYFKGRGYEKTANDAASEFRRDGDEDAAKYIEIRGNKRQFAKDAIKRAKKRRKLLGVE